MKPFKKFADHVRDFHLTHANKYQYIEPSEEELTTFGVKTRIKIICPQHGMFEQTIANHKVQNGCPVCSINSRYKRQYDKDGFTHQELEAEIKRKYGNQYQIFIPETPTLAEESLIYVHHVICFHTSEMTVRDFLSTKNGGCQGCMSRGKKKVVYLPDMDFYI